MPILFSDVRSLEHGGGIVIDIYQARDLEWRMVRPQAGGKGNTN
jgi:hypothetical protein